MLNGAHDHEHTKLTNRLLHKQGRRKPRSLHHPRRRVKTQGSFPSESCALVLLYSLVASGQINLRRIDGYEKIVDVIAREEDAAA